MSVRQRHSGVSIPGILIIMIMVGFFLMCAIRMFPPYFEYLSVKGIISGIAVEKEPGTETIGQIRRRIANIFNSNQIYELEPKDVEIYRKKGRTYIDANYEVRVPVMGRIDAVLKFDDLLYVVGSPDPVEPTAATKK